MARYLVGGWLTSGLYVLTVGLSVWLTGWHTPQPGSLDSRERIRSSHPARPWARLIIGQLIVTAAWITKYDSINRASRHWLHLSALATFVALLLAIGVLFAPVRGWYKLLITVYAVSLSWWILARPSLLASQLVIMLVVLATVGKAAQVPMWFAHTHPRFSLISVPLWTFIMVDAAVLDFFTQPTDVRVNHVLARAWGGESQPPLAAKATGVQAVLDSHQYFSLGVAAPIAGALFLTVMAVLSREYGRTVLITVPFTTMVVSLGAGLTVALATHGRIGLAGPWIAGGVIVGVLIAAKESKFWPLLMDPGQDWHHDPSHKLF